MLRSDVDCVTAERELQTLDNALSSCQRLVDRSAVLGEQGELHSGPERLDDHRAVELALLGDEFMVHDREAPRAHRSAPRASVCKSARFDSAPR